MNDLFARLPVELRAHICRSLVSLGQLAAAIRTCRSLYQGFLADRNSILRTVFGKDLVCEQPTPDSGPTGSRPAVQWLCCKPVHELEQNYTALMTLTGRCLNAPEDVLLFHETLWKSMSATFPHGDIAQCCDCPIHECGLSLIHAYLAAGREDSAWRVAEVFRKRYGRPGWVQTRGGRKISKVLVRVYQECGEYRQFIDIQKGLLDPPMWEDPMLWFDDSVQLEALLSCYRRHGLVHEMQAFLSEKLKVVFDDVEQCLAEGQPLHRFIYWARAATVEHQRQRQVEKTIALQKSVLEIMCRAKLRQYSFNPAWLEPDLNLLEPSVLTGWARCLIRSLKRQGRHSEALCIKARIWEMLKPLSIHASTWPGLYLGWAVELAHDYRHAREVHETLVVEMEMCEVTHGFAKSAREPFGEKRTLFHAIVASRRVEASCWKLKISFLAARASCCRKSLEDRLKTVSK